MTDVTPISIKVIAAYSLFAGIDHVSYSDFREIAFEILERETGFKPATFALARRRRDD